MASLADWIKNQTQDYGQLKNAYPNAVKFGSALKKGISQLVPTQEDLNSPQKMGEWGLSAALNAPMGLMFVGPKSAGWDAVKASEAEKLLNAGVDPAQVWKEHLIGRMPDKSLFSEISDAEAKAIPKQEWKAMHQKQHEHGQEAEWQMSGFLSHPELQQTYPSIGGQLNKPYDLFSTRFSVSGLADQKGHYLPERDSIHIGMNPLNKNEIDKSIALHEIQHAIQNKEGWAMGGNPEQMREEALAMLRRDVANGEIPSTEQAMDMLPMAQHNAYRRLTGETQARATQDRMNMNMQQRRESYPLANDMLSDIPLKNLINRYGNGGPSMSTLSKTDLNKIIKKLETNNKSTVPKIPTENIFNNRLGEIPLDTRLKADKYFSENNKPQQINISDIVPTQKNITLSNLKGVNNIEEPVNAVMINGKYYLTDGHHRVSLANLNNEKSILANVFKDMR